MAANAKTEIRARGTYSEADLWAATQTHADYQSMAWNILRILGALLLVLGGVGVFGGAIFHGAVLVLVGIFWLFGVKWWWFWFTKRVFRRTPSYQVESEALFTENFVSSSSELGKSELGWGYFVKWKEGPKSFLLYTSDLYFFFWPKRFFENETDIQAVRTLLSTRIPSKK